MFCVLWRVHCVCVCESVWMAFEILRMSANLCALCFLNEKVKSFF